jgi:hypothetical protein
MMTKKFFILSEQSGGQQTNKKRTTFSRFLRGLKTGHRKEKHSGSSPRHTRSNARGLQAGRVSVMVLSQSWFYTQLRMEKKFP